MPTKIKSLVHTVSGTQAQWVNVDVRDFDLSVLGQFGVIMADPPWEVRTYAGWVDRWTGLD